MAGQSEDEVSRAWTGHEQNTRQRMAEHMAEHMAERGHNKISPKTAHHVCRRADRGRGLCNHQHDALQSGGGVSECRRVGACVKCIVVSLGVALA